VQPPVGQFTSQRLLPAQLSVEPEPMVMLASAPPVTETLLSGPVSSTQLLCPAHDDVQPAAHVPTQVAPAAQFVVQPVPQFTLHVVPVLQVYVTLSATVPPPSTSTPPSVPPPNSQVAPDAQAHALPSHWQPPSVVDVQFAAPLASGRAASAAPVSGGGGGGVVAVVVGAVSTEPSGVAITPSSSSPPQPTATPTPTRLADPSRTKSRAFVMAI
jgi:hypothetical protein